MFRLENANVVFEFSTLRANVQMHINHLGKYYLESIIRNHLGKLHIALQILGKNHQENHSFRRFVEQTEFEGRHRSSANRHYLRSHSFVGCKILQVNQINNVESQYSNSEKLEWAV